jgi:hypothetical protein
MVTIMGASGSNSKLYATLLIVLILAGGSLAALFFMQQSVDGDEPSISVVGSDDTTRIVTLSELQSMPAIVRSNAFENSYGNTRGQGDYVGARISDIIDLVGGMSENEVIIVNASDGYSQIFTYDNVHPNASMYSIQGDMVLAYEYNQTVIPDYEDGPRLMFLPEDGFFTNDDASMAFDSQFFSGAAGPKLVSNVAEIIITDRPEGTILDVSVGDSTKSYTLSDIMGFEAVSGLGGFKNRFGTLFGPMNYTGVPMQILVNDVGAFPSNYEVITTASDGYSITYDQAVAEGIATGYNNTSGDSLGDVNCTMIIAYYEDSEPIDTEIPLRIGFINDEGYLTDSFLWLREVVNITIRDMGAKILNVQRGETIQSYSLLQLMDMPSVTGNGGYKKSSGTIVGPFTYTGLLVEYLLNQTGDLPVEYTVEIVADDGYTTYYNKSHIDGWFDAYNATTGDPVGLKECPMILAYYEDDEPIPSGGPLRVATLNNDGYLTDGHFWAKFVVNITLIDEVEPWELELRGPQEWNMTHDIYYSLASCSHHRIDIMRGGSTYAGVPLWTIISSMDGGEDAHYTFNVSLAVSGYNVTIFDSLGGKFNFTSAQLAGNASILIAGWVNGSLLDSPDWPLKLVTPSGVLLGNVVRIVMWGWD